jgi:hypothetical protein
MAEPDKRPVTLEELLVSSLSQTDALAKLLIERGSSHEKSLCRRSLTNGLCIKSFFILLRNELQSYCTEAAKHWPSAAPRKLESVKANCKRRLIN